jgi:hypothetical protein
MSSSLGLRCPVRSSCCPSTSIVYLIAWLAVAGSATAVSAQTAPADAIYVGDTVVMIKDGVELGLRDKPAVTLKTGDKIRVTEVRGVWIGGHATVDGQRYSGWVNRREVRLAGTDPGAVAPIEAPALPDDPGIPRRPGGAERQTGQERQRPCDFRRRDGIGSRRRHLESTSRVYITWPRWT